MTGSSAEDGGRVGESGRGGGAANEAQSAARGGRNGLALPFRHVAVCRQKLKIEIRHAVGRLDLLGLALASARVRPEAACSAAGVASAKADGPPRLNAHASRPPQRPRGVTLRKPTNNHNGNNNNTVPKQRKNEGTARDLRHLTCNQ